MSVCVCVRSRASCHYAFQKGSSGLSGVYHLRDVRLISSILKGKISCSDE